jgi:hypothetical protein
MGTTCNDGERLYGNGLDLHFRCWKVGPLAFQWR